MDNWYDATADERDRVIPALRELAGKGAQFSDHRVRTWASITFAGERHMLTARFHGPQAVGEGELFASFLPEHEFAIPGWIVADAAVLGVTSNPGKYLGVSIELLLLDEHT